MLRTYWEQRLWTSIDIIYFQLFKSIFWEKKDSLIALLNDMQALFNPIQPGVSFLYPPSKTSGFLMFSGGIEKQHRAVLG